jgi:hypothetical protein
MSVTDESHLARQVYEMKCAIKLMGEKLKSKDLKIVELQGYSSRRSSIGTQTDTGASFPIDFCGGRCAPNIRRLNRTIEQLRLQLRALLEQVPSRPDR